MYFKSKDGSKIYYETHGNKENPTILMLHGIGADHDMWEPQIKKYSNEGYYVVVMDLRAHGKSAKVKELTLDDWAGDIIALVEHLETELFCIIGVSMGGVIAQYFVSKYPDKVEKVVLSDTFGELKTITEKLLGFSQVIGFSIFKLLGKKVFAKAMASTYKKLGAKKAEKYFYNASLNSDFSQLLLARKAINKIDILDRLKKFDKPTLVLVGDSAGQVFVKVNKKIADSIKNSKFEVIKGSMDPSNLVKTEEFNQKVLKFLKEK
jgi:pimeloyl-ACP methyl ester carboxylesterase